MTTTINANIRSNVSKGENHRLRESGRIPAVVYGLNKQNFNVEIAEEELFDILSTKGEHAVIDINLNGNHEQAIIKEVQRDPIKRNVIHVDLQRIDSGRKIQAKIPVKVVGEDYIRRNGGMTQKQVAEIEVMCTPEKLPRYLTADVSGLRIGDRVTLGDIEAAEEISIIGDPSTIVVAVSRVKEMKLHPGEDEGDTDSIPEEAK